MAVTADRADGLFDGAAAVEKIDAVERGRVDRRRLIELTAASGEVSERCRGRREIGERGAIWCGDAAMVMRCRS
jgi:hypothetical protein